MEYMKGFKNPAEDEGIEMGLLHRGPRTATVVARTAMTVQVIDADGFDRILDEAPSVTRALLRLTSRRLATSSETVARLLALAEETTIRIGEEPGAEAEEARARRDLETLGRRWSSNPNVYYVLLLVVLVIILAIAL